MPTALFNAGVPEKVVINRALCSCTNTREQRQMVFSVLVQGKQSFQVRKENIPDTTTVPTPLPATIERSLLTNEHLSYLLLMFFVLSSPVCRNV